MEDYRFHHFQKVICRQSDKDYWQGNFFSHYEPCSRAICIDGKEWKECVPYNEDTRHLLGTTEPIERYSEETLNYNEWMELKWLFNMGYEKKHIEQAKREREMINKSKYQSYGNKDEF